ncbi:hypothetical protein, partial [Bacillus subtilis]|uniref:hypothetical protein n=1 Tax=Bacillus subtilis TaxID=1423 RepID=UPI00055761D8
DKKRPDFGSAKIEKKPAENSRLFLKPKTQRSKPFFPRRGGDFFFKNRLFLYEKAFLSIQKHFFHGTKENGWFGISKDFQTAENGALG